MRSRFEVHCFSLANAANFMQFKCSIIVEVFLFFLLWSTLCVISNSLHLWNYEKSVPTYVTIRVFKWRLILKHCDNWTHELCRNVHAFRYWLMKDFYNSNWLKSFKCSNIECEHVFCLYFSMWLNVHMSTCVFRQWYLLPKDGYEITVWWTKFLEVGGLWVTMQYKVQNKRELT